MSSLIIIISTFICIVGVFRFISTSELSNFEPIEDFNEHESWFKDQEGFEFMPDSLPELHSSAGEFKPVHQDNYGGMSSGHLSAGFSHNSHSSDSHPNPIVTPIVVNNHQYKHKDSIVINSNKQSSAPIIITHGHGHLKHLSDIIIHDQKCGTPTRIKETKHGLFGLFHKSHIIIIGKDCKLEPKFIPIFAPKIEPHFDLHRHNTNDQPNHQKLGNWNDHTHNQWIEEGDKEQHKSIEQIKGFPRLESSSLAHNQLSDHNSDMSGHLEIEADVTADSKLDLRTTQLTRTWKRDS